MLKNYKRWAQALTGVMLLFIGLNAIIWTFFTRDILTFKPYYNGGLDRLGYIVGSKDYRVPETTLPRGHIENRDYQGQHVDVVTIGDSFSNMGSNGRDPLYQDWIASLYHLEVLNVQTLPGKSQLSTAVILLNSGYLDKVKPRFLIVETVERHCIGDPYEKLDLRQSAGLEVIERYYRTAAFSSHSPETSFVNTGNFKFLMNNVLYRLSDRAYFSQVYVRELSTPLFSVKNDRLLLFYWEDIYHLRYQSKQKIEQFNDDLNGLADRLRAKGIRLLFLPAADKYNVYRDYIVDNPYPDSRFFEVLRQLPKHYLFVDTKALLLEEVRKGEKDVYYADDTHWSWKGAKKIAEAMRF